MTVALLSIGTELTRGEIVNTNAAWLAAELTAAGFDVAAIEAVPDDLDAVVARDPAARAPRIASSIVTGGLGPDDRRPHRRRRRARRRASSSCATRARCSRSAAASRRAARR